MQGNDKLPVLFSIKKTYDTHYDLESVTKFDLKDLSDWERYEMHDLLIEKAREIEDAFPEVVGMKKVANPNHNIIKCPENRVGRSEGGNREDRLAQALRVATTCLNRSHNCFAHELIHRKIIAAKNEIKDILGDIAQEFPMQDK